MKVPRYSDSQIMTILKQAETDAPVLEACREHGMSSASFFTNGGPSIAVWTRRWSPASRSLKMRIVG